MRFFCDDHLRKLARWLRAAGYDVAWELDIGDVALAARCRAEGRILLTLDRRLDPLPGVEVTVLPSHDPRRQLAHVVSHYELNLRDHAFSRCTVCNVELEEGSGDEAPPRVRETCDHFRRCPACGRTYWEGTHVDRMRRLFDEVCASMQDAGK